MPNCNDFKNDLFEINDELGHLLLSAKDNRFIAEETFKHWDSQCKAMRRQLTHERIRMAVVGPIKSGKSTFINSLLDGDFLKRGAGVVTSIITRIRPGRSLKAQLFFKSWDQINAEIREALVLFPEVSEWKPRKESFDIRLDTDRRDLKNALAALNRKMLVSKDARDENSMLLTSYLNGFEEAREAIAASNDDLILDYQNETFLKHQRFVGNDSLAVYLKDVEIQIDRLDRFGDIEIADCQGSDSINPLHLNSIQQYLLAANMVIYVISSRTGLRRADMDFLSIIKKMGIEKNVLFVINFDFNEHNSYDDLTTLIDKIKEDIALIHKKASVYALSALFNLFASQKKALSEKEKNIFAQWRNETALIAFADKETASLDKALSRKLVHERSELLYVSAMAHQKLILKGLSRQLSINRKLLEKDAQFAEAFSHKIAAYQEKMKNLEHVIRRAIDGAVQELRLEVFRETDRFFDSYGGSVLKRSLEFIKNYQAEYHQYEEQLSTDRVSSVLYYVFQDFKRQLDAFLVERIHPEIIGFVNECEKKITEYIESVAKPYNFMIKEVFNEFAITAEQLEIHAEYQTQPGIQFPRIDTVKADANLSVPPIIASMHYSAGVRTEAVMRAGAYWAIGFTKKIFKRPFLSEKQKKIQALEHAVLRMKEETQKAVGFNFKSHRENLKFQYLLKLIKIYSQSVSKALEEACQTYFIDASKIETLMTTHEVDKGAVLAKIAQTERQAAILMDKMDSLKAE